MFLLVLAFSFLAAKTISKNEFERFTDLEDVLVEPEEFLVVSEHSKDIFIIDDSAHSNNYYLESLKETNLPKSSNFVSTFFSSWRNLIGKRLINLST